MAGLELGLMGLPADTAAVGVVRSLAGRLAAGFHRLPAHAVLRATHAAHAGVRQVMAHPSRLG